MKKNWLKLITIFILIFMLLTACHSNESSSDPDQSSQSSESSSETSSEPEQDPTAVQDENLLEKLVDAHNKNTDTVAWLKVMNTTINDSVVQASDNDYYLRRNISGGYDFYGCYFADFRCVIGEDVSRNFVIYGHSMEDNPNGLKFAQLNHYLDQEFLEKYPYIYVTTAEQDLVYKVFAVFYTDTNFYYIEPNPTDAEFSTVLSEAKLRSEFITDVDVNTSDKILTLSTCTYLYGSRLDQRFVVMARLLRDGEKVTDPISVQENPNPKAPQF